MEPRVVAAPLHRCRRVVTTVTRPNRHRHRSVAPPLLGFAAVVPLRGRPSNHIEQERQRDLRSSWESNHRTQAPFTLPVSPPSKLPLLLPDFTSDFQLSSPESWSSSPPEVVTGAAAKPVRRLPLFWFCHSFFVRLFPFQDMEDEASGELCLFFVYSIFLYYRSYCFPSPLSLLSL
ncbi:uncharacterized protein DS421_3g91070 [Arachis hypogaea]|nr:uncharacterized protein DS421_3g91070 [Arachis hypogaea]